MTILLDECVPSALKEALLPNEAFTTRMAGWHGIKNGELLALAQNRFDAFVTVDKGIVHQHPPGRFRLRIVCVRSVTNRAEDVLPYLPLIVRELFTMQEGEVRTIERRRF